MYGDSSSHMNNKLALRNYFYAVYFVKLHVFHIIKSTVAW